MNPAPPGQGHIHPSSGQLSSSGQLLGRSPDKLGGMADPVVLDAAFEGLYVRGLGPRVTPMLKEKMRTVGIDLDQMKPRYPREIWVRGLDVAARELYPRLPLAEAYRQLGDVAVSGIGNTLIGKAIVSMAKMLGPRRAMYRLNQAFGSLNNFMTVAVTEHGPTHFTLVINDAYDRPTYIMGALCAAMTMSGAKEIVMKPVPGAMPPPGVTLDVTFKT